MEDYLIFSESNCPSYIGENYNFLFNIFSESENLLSLKNKINPKTEFATSATKSDSHLNLNFDNNKNIFDNNLEQKNISIDKNMQFINKKKRRITKSGLHNKFADDNLRRKCKHLVLKSLLEFINGEIERRYKNNIGKGILKKQLLTINQKQKSDSSAQFNKDFLNRNLKDIFSEPISARFSIYHLDHNEILIKELINDKNEEIRQFFTTLFNLTFTQCLGHFRQTENIKELEGLKGFDQIKTQFIEDHDYLETLKYYIYHYEEITKNKRTRNRKKKIQDH